MLGYHATGNSGQFLFNTMILIFMYLFDLFNFYYSIFHLIFHVLQVYKEENSGRRLI